MKKNSLHLLLLAGGIGTVFTLAGTWKLHDLERDAAIKEFKIHVNECVASLDREIALNFEVLHSLKILFDRSEPTTHEEFSRAATAALKRHANIQALEWIPRVSHSDRSSFETARRSRLHSFEFTDQLQQGKMVRAADREEYYPVYFMEPFVGNELALGFDLASNPARLAALEESRASGRLRASEPITLVQEHGNQKGFLAYLPVYDGEPSTLSERRNSLKGFVLGVYRIGAIFNSALAPLNIQETQMTLIDDLIHLGDKVLFERVPESKHITIRDVGYRKSLHDVAGRSWRLLAFPTKTYISARMSIAPHIFAVSGILITLFLVGYLLLILRRSVVIEALVQERTRDLREALSQIKALSGLLPICASCKKIRDDRGYWNQIETYISEHSEATFSHGLCEVCTDKLYGQEDWYRKRKKPDNKLLES